ncbi:MAG: DUF4059 family protein [Streptococcaceae bacterium]|jgi:ribose/xylose/arabinose/galactoside ABC-type transport system permease subunit|nr:DUF4059 family protein [Streptococcaceae bacterium]
MISLVLQFYIPAFLVTLLLALVVAVLATVIFFSGKRSNEPGRGAQFFHELFILNLLIIPVLSFAFVAIFVIVKSISV